MKKIKALLLAIRTKFFHVHQYCTINNSRAAIRKPNGDFDGYITVLTLYCPLCGRASATPADRTEPIPLDKRA